MTLKCPICKKRVRTGEEDFPFCSARCREIDLGNWASEKYVVSEPAQSSSEMEEPEEDD